MAACTLAVRTDRDAYRPGQRIDGTVELRVEEPVECRALSVTTQWFVTGTGERENGPTAPVVLHRGPLAPGEHRMPFTLRAPRGPATYDGPTLHLRHRVLARADLARAGDAAGEAEYTLLAVDVEGYDHGPAFVAGPWETRTFLEERPLPGPVVLLVFAAVVLLCAFGERIVYGPPVVLAVIGFVVITVGVLAAWRSLRTIASVPDSLGSPTLEVRPGTLHPGDTVEVAVTLAPARSIRMRRAMVELEGEETVATRTGRGERRTVVRRIHLQSAALDVPERVAAGERRTFRTSLAVPPDAGPSLATDGENEVAWTVTAHLSTRDGAAWRSTTILEVRPPRTAPGASGGS